MKLFGLMLVCSHLCLGDVYVKEGSLPHNVQRRAPRRSVIGTEFRVSGGWDVSVGDTVAMSCTVTTDKDNKADTAKLQLVRTKPGDNSKTVLATETASKGISYALGPVTSEHRGMYSCYSDGSNPAVYITERHKLLWVKDSSAPVSIGVISVNRVKYFHDKTVTIGCLVPDDNSQWKIMRCDNDEGVFEECPGHVIKDNVVSCSISLDYPLELPYWCQSAAGQMSNVLNASNAMRELRQREEIVETTFKVTPSWFLRPGDSAVLDCSVHTDRHNNSNNMDLQLIWTQLVPDENNMKVLLSQRASQGFKYSLVNVTRDHQGVYTCWDDGTLSKVSVHPWHHFIWVEDESPTVTINVVSPSRTHHDEKVTVGCQLPDDQSQWKINSFDQVTGKINNCRNAKLSSSRFLSCIKFLGNQWFNKLFWCESSTGEKSNLLNTTNTDVQRPPPRKSPIATKFSVPGGWDLSVGDTVVLTCKVTGDRDNKADTTKLQLVWTKLGENSKTVLMTETASKGISYTLGPVTYEHRGMYSCLSDGSNPDVILLDYHELVWVKDPTASVNVEVISLNRVKYFYDTTVTVGCRVPDDNSQWKILRCNEVKGVTEECPRQIRQDNVVSCTISTEYPLYMPYWCQSAAGQMSNVHNVSNTVREMRNSEEIVSIRFEVTPAWFLRAGDSTVLDCNVRSDEHNNSNNMDLQLIRTQSVPEDNKMKVLLSQRASQGFKYSLVNVTRDHQGGYTCWDDGTLPKVSVHPWHHFIWVEDGSPQVTINVVSHNRTQFFHNEKVTFGCQLPNDQSKWKLKWFDQYTGKINNCPYPQLSPSRFLSCIEYMGNPWSDKLFWCESSTGERSNLLNTTNTVAKIVLEAPMVPVTEGDDITLRCWLQDRNTQKISSARSGFHNNLRFIRLSEEGTITINGVTKADEGFYQCSTREEGMSHKSWITVKARN